MVEEETATTGTPPAGGDRSDQPDRRNRIVVLAPSPQLTIGIDSSAGVPELHIHAGGQGVWVARMASTLAAGKATVTLCHGIGGETGSLLGPLLDREDVELVPVFVEATNGAVIHDDRDHERREIVRMPSTDYSRHDTDSLYGAALAQVLHSRAAVVTGTQPLGVLPTDFYARLAKDARANGTHVIADLTGDALKAVVDAGVTALKLDEHSLSTLIGDPPPDDETLVKTVRSLLDSADLVVVNRGARSTVVAAGREVFEVFPPTVHPRDPHGGGDSWTAALAVGLATDLPLADTLRIGAAAATSSVVRRGLGTGRRPDIIALSQAVRVTQFRSRTEYRMTSQTEPEVFPTATQRTEFSALVTNDDGIDSEGLRRLAIAAEVAGLHVTVAAPMTDSSGASASIQHRRTGKQVAVERRELDGVAGDCYAVDSNPGFIALTGVRGAFGHRPDFVLSGINRGWNTGHVIVHSGTVGAALSAALQGCRAMAVSAASSSHPNWTTPAAAATLLLPFLRASEPGTLLNVNVPDLDEHDVQGVRWAPLAPFGTVQTVAAELGTGHLELSIDDPLLDVPPDTDAALVNRGFITVTALTGMSEAPTLGELPSLPQGRG